MSKKKEPSNICPICGKKAIALDIWDNGEVYAVHSIVLKIVKSSATGNMIECEVPSKVCRKVK